MFKLLNSQKGFFCRGGTAVTDVTIKNESLLLINEKINKMPPLQIILISSKKIVEAVSLYLSLFHKSRSLMCHL